MNLIKPINKKPAAYRNFTGAPGHSLDWQIGFEDPMFLNFLGIGNKAEDLRRAEVLAQVRANYYPPPAACSTGTEQLPRIKGGTWSANAIWEKAACGSACQYVTDKIPFLRKEIAEAQRKIDSGESKDVAPRYLAAYTQILDEYISYYNSNCLNNAPADQGQGNITSSGAAVNGAAPLGTGGSLVNTTVTPGATTTAPVTGTGSSALPLTPGSSFVKRVPTWAWWTGGGILAAVTIAIIVKNKRS